MVKFNSKEVKMKKVCMFLVLCLVAMGAYGQDDEADVIIMAKGVDEDIGGYLNPNPLHSAETLIVGKIVFDEAGMPVGQVEFHMTIYVVESGKKVYSIKGHLENATFVMYPIPNYCSVRGVTWINLWFVMGQGRAKTTDVLIENFEYRGNLITLPNTEGKFVPFPIVMLVSPEGQYVGGVWPEGGWAYAGVVLEFDPLSGMPVKLFGGITWLTKYVENWIP